MRAFNTLIKNPEGKIKYKRFRQGGKEHFQIGLWIDDSEEKLNSIKTVEYILHKSFKRRVRTSSSRSDNFSITFWAWGRFDIQVKVMKKTGVDETFIHSLKIDLPPDDGSNYIDVSKY